MFIKHSLVRYREFWTSLVVQLLRLHTSNVGGMGSIPGQETKISHAEQAKKRKRERPWVPVQEDVLWKESDKKPGKRRPESSATRTQREKGSKGASGKRF